MLGGRGANALFGLVLTLAITRYLGPEGFGLFSYANSLVIVGGALAGFGLDTWMVREIARHPETAEETLANVLGIKYWTSLSIIILLILIKFLSENQYIQSPLLFFSLVIFFNSRSQTYWYYADAVGKFQYHSVLWAVTNALRMLFGVGTLVFLLPDIFQAPQ